MTNQAIRMVALVCATAHCAATNFGKSGTVWNASSVIEASKMYEEYLADKKPKTGKKWKRRRKGI